MAETTEVDQQVLGQWFDANLILLLVIGGSLVALYISSARIVHAVVSRALAAQAGQVVEGSGEAAELQKRAATLESLITALLRIFLTAVLVTIVIGLLDLWSVMAGLGLLLAALTVAGQSIVLDYLMGILIIVEGQYYKGDTIDVGVVSGTVEDVGLRRTTVRAADGTVHSISNGEISYRLQSDAGLRGRGGERAGHPGSGPRTGHRAHGPRGPGDGRGPGVLSGDHRGGIGAVGQRPR